MLMTHRMIVTGLLMVQLQFGACGTVRAPQPDPTAIIQTWHQALVDERPEDAWALLSHEGRDGLDEVTFKALIKQHRSALLAHAETLMESLALPESEQRARVKVGDHVVELVLRPEGWRILTPLTRASGSDQ